MSVLSLVILWRWGNVKGVARAVIGNSKGRWINEGLFPYGTDDTRYMIQCLQGRGERGRNRVL